VVGRRLGRNRKRRVNRLRQHAGGTMLTLMVVDALPALPTRGRRNDPPGFARAMGESYTRFGFAIVRDHGLDAGVIARALDATKAFFALPATVKRPYHLEGQAGQRGYIPFGVEAAKNAD